MPGSPNSNFSIRLLNPDPLLLRTSRYLPANKYPPCVTLKKAINDADVDLFEFSSQTTKKFQIVNATYCIQSYHAQGNSDPGLEAGVVGTVDWPMQVDPDLGVSISMPYASGITYTFDSVCIRTACVPGSENGHTHDYINPVDPKPAN